MSESSGSIRSRVKWIKEGERCTKYFLILEKNNGLKEHIKSIKNACGTVLLDTKEILQEEVNFFKELYADKGISLTDIDTYLNNSNVIGLTKEEQSICEGGVTIKECDETINKMKLNKSPGCDGLTVEFYQYFWKEIRQIVCDSINISYEINEMSSTQKRGVISLLYKKRR